MVSYGIKIVMMIVIIVAMACVCMSYDAGQIYKITLRHASQTQLAKLVLTSWNSNPNFADYNANSKHPVSTLDSEPCDEVSGY